MDLRKHLEQNHLIFEVWHRDKVGSDVGGGSLPLIELTTSPVKKSERSYVHVHDGLLPIYEFDDSGRPIFKIGDLRTICYLEDLGPKDQIDKQLSSKFQSEADGIKTEPRKYDFMNEFDPEKESRFKLHLKQEEVKFLERLSEEWNRKDNEKERIFKQHQASLHTTESKLRSKATQLQKREQKIILLEEELKQRITEAAKQISGREDEISMLKRKIRDEKDNGDKQTNFLQSRYNELNAKYEILSKEYSSYRREQENSPISLLRHELDSRLSEITSLKSEVQRLNGIKGEYKTYYERARNEIGLLKQQLSDLKLEMASRHSKEMEEMRMKLLAFNFGDEKENFESLRRDIHNIGRITYPDHQESNPLFFQSNSSKQNIYETSAEKKKRASKSKSLKAARIEPHSDIPKEFSSLREERDFLVHELKYDENDPLIIELDRQIRNN